MAGKDGLAERLQGRLLRLDEVLGAQIERWAQSPVEHAAEADKVGKSGRSLAMGVRSIADALGAVDKLRTDSADEDIVAVDLDGAPALADERSDLWTRLGACPFITDAERRRMAGLPPTPDLAAEPGAES